MAFRPIGGGSGGAGGGSTAWADITDKPSTFPADLSSVTTAAQAKAIAYDAVSGGHPGVGGYLVPQNVNSSGGSALASGTMGLAPIVLPDGCNWDAMAVNVSTAAVGGTYSLALAIYADTSAGNAQLTAGAPLLASATLTDLSSTGVKIATFDAPTGVLAGGAYVLAGLYIASVAPSPAPQAFALNGSYANSSTSSTFSGWTTTRGRGKRRNGSTSLAEGIAAATWTAATGTEVLAMAIRRSA